MAQPAQPMFERLKIQATPRDTRAYFSGQYSLHADPAPVPQAPGRRPFVAYKGAPLRQIEQSPPETDVERETETIWRIPSPIPRLLISPPPAGELPVPEQPGLAQLESVAGGLARGLAGIEGLQATIASNVVRAQAAALDCRHMADLTKVMCDVSVQHLDAVHGGRSQRSSFHEVIDFLKAVFHAIYRRDSADTPSGIE
jgi:hypothetical protein